MSFKSLIWRVRLPLVVKLTPTVTESVISSSMLFLTLRSGLFFLSHGLISSTRGIARYKETWQKKKPKEPLGHWRWLLLLTVFLALLSCPFGNKTCSGPRPLNWVLLFCRTWLELSFVSLHCQGFFFLFKLLATLAQFLPVLFLGVQMIQVFARFCSFLRVTKSTMLITPVFSLFSLERSLGNLKYLLKSLSWSSLRALILSITF